jgi:hypothetical protein
MTVNNRVGFAKHADQDIVIEDEDGLRWADLRQMEPFSLRQVSMLQRSSRASMLRLCQQRGMIGWRVLNNIRPTVLSFAFHSRTSLSRWGTPHAPRSLSEK